MLNYLKMVFVYLLITNGKIHGEIDSDKIMEKLDYLSAAFHKVFNVNLNTESHPGSPQLLEEKINNSCCVNDTHEGNETHQHILQIRDEFTYFRETIRDEFRHFRETMLVAFTAEKLLRRKTNEKMERNAHYIVTQLDRLVASDETINNELSEKENLLDSLREAFGDLRLKVDMETAANRELIRRDNCSDRVNQVEIDNSDITNKLKITNVHVNRLQNHMVYVSKGTNLALQQKAYQSSTYDGNTADRGIDGTTTTKLHAGTCFHTDNDDQPWWMVELDQGVFIGRVVLYNRGDCCGERLKDFVVSVSLERDSGDIEFGRRMGPSTNGEVITLTKDEPVFGRYLKVQLMGSGAYLHLCEVQIFSY